MIDKEKLKHRTERAPGFMRNEIYEYEDLTYTESYDDETGKLMLARVTIYGDVQACNVWEDGSINFVLPTTWVVNRKMLLYLMDDLKRLDEFLCVISEAYKNRKD